MIVGVIFFLVLFGEVVFKVYVCINNLQFVWLMFCFLDIMMWLFYLVSNILVWFINIMERCFVGVGNGNSFSWAEIDEVIELMVSQEKGVGRDIDILKSIVKFGDVIVKQIMCFWVDVVVVDF